MIKNLDFRKEDATWLIAGREKACFAHYTYNSLTSHHGYDAIFAF